jgi:murein DD-endopeptidase MepM/ murein hydrolase activator NlpD
MTIRIRLGHRALVNRFLRWSCSFAFCCLPNWAQTAAVATIHAAPGTAVRWVVAGTTTCAANGRSWAAVNGTCYYPIDLAQAPGQRISISRTTTGKAHFGHIVVDAIDYGTEDITLPDIPQANPGAADLRRDELDRMKLAKIFNRKEGLPKFTLPLGPPARPLPPAKSFGVKRIFNGKPASQPHTGVDFATPVGSPVLAVANGTVRIAEDLFFEGNAVFIDHGDGLISMYFHLSDIKVKVGDEVKKGETLGRVGSTGRATGPHLFFGIRWHDARIDPKFVLEDPAKIPSIP